MENNLKDQHYKNMGITPQMDTLAFEAESCAFVVLSHFGLDTSDYSFLYIGGWSSNREMKEVKSSMDTIRRTSSEIIDGVEAGMREQLLERDADRYEIYQIGEESEARDYKFMDLEYLHSHGVTVRKEDYDLVYTAPLEPGETLEGLYEKFNLNQPADYTGHSLSVSDVVLIHKDGEDYVFFVDTIGFTEVPEFLVSEPEKEMQAEQIMDAGVQEPGKDISQEQVQPKLTYYVAECMEFPVLGEYHEVQTMEEAKALLDTIPSDRMNGGKGIGFNLQDGSDYAGSYPLVQGGKVVSEKIALVEHYRDSPLVSKAIEEARQYFPDARENEYQPREAMQAEPVVEQTRIETSTPVKEAAAASVDHQEGKQIASESRSGGRRESVLNALRERQKQVKEKDAKETAHKPHEHKKGEQSL